MSHTGIFYVRIANCLTRAGDFTASLEASRHAIAYAESIGDDEQLASGLHGAALQLAKLGRLDEALPLGQKEYEIAQKCGHPVHLIRAMWLVASQYGAKGRARDNIAMLNQALPITRATKDPSLIAAILESLSIAYIGLGDLETAAYMQKQILAMPQADLNSPTTTYSPAITYNNLGEVELRMGHGAEARKSFEQALETSKGPDDWRVHQMALLNLADMQNAAGHFAESDASFSEAMAMVEDLKFPELKTAAHRMRSDALLARNDLKGALTEGNTALGLAREVAAPDRVYKALLSVGSAKAATGDSIAARADFEEALRIAETLRAQSPGEVSDLRGAFASLLPLYQASVRNLIDLHLPTEALQRAEQAKARVLMDILRRGGVDERSVMTSAESAEQDAIRKRVAAANAAVSRSPSPAALRALQEVMVEFRQSRRILYDRHPELAVQSADFEPVGVDKLSALASGPKTALLDYFFIPSGVALFVVRSTGVTSYIVPDSKHTLVDEAHSFRVKLANRELDYRVAAQRLFNRLLAPAMADLRGATDWVISPDGALWDIPFQALVDPAGKHVMESRTVSLTPSLTAALEMRKRESGATGGIRLLAFGNPLPSPSPLPDAVREVSEISATYPRGSALIRTGTEATVAEFRDKAPSARVIHLAAHAGLNNSDPLSSFVNLGGGGTLTALEIMSIHLNADLVVLSACETAGGSTGPGEGMIGMGWALSAAGASSSVLSSWKVDSAASRDFMTSFYRNLSADGGTTSKSAALRQAGLRMLQSPNYRHPFYWAAFTLWGDGSPGSGQMADPVTR